MTPRPDVSEERRTQILDTAEDVFAKRGFDEARMDDIAEQSGLSKGAVYWYFKKKDDIIAALLYRVFRRSLEAMRRIAAEEATARERLKKIGEQVSADYHAMSRLMPVALEFYAIALRRKPIRRHLAKIYEEMFDILTPLIEEGIRAGEFARVDARHAATLFVAMYEGMGLVWAISPKHIDWVAIGPDAVTVLLDGIGRR